MASGKDKKNLDTKSSSSSAYEGSIVRRDSISADEKNVLDAKIDEMIKAQSSPSDQALSDFLFKHKVKQTTIQMQKEALRPKTKMTAQQLHDHAIERQQAEAHLANEKAERLQNKDTTKYVPMPSVDSVKQHEKKPARPTAQEMHALLKEQKIQKQTLPKKPQISTVNQFVEAKNANKSLPKKPVRMPDDAPKAAPAAKVTGSRPIGMSDAKGKRDVNPAPVNKGKIAQAPVQSKPLPQTPGPRPEVPKVPLPSPHGKVPPAVTPNKPVPVPSRGTKGTREFGRSAEAARRLPPESRDTELERRKALKAAARKANPRTMIPGNDPKLSTKIRKP